MPDPKPVIAAEAIALCRDHPLAEDTNFLVHLSEALARLHSSAPHSERIGVLNRTTAEHYQNLDAAALAEARTEAAKAERARIAAILALDEANGREASARHLALNTELTADEAKGVLDGLPRSAWASAPKPVPTHDPQTGEPFLRAADAPGGLVLEGEDGKPRLAEAGELAGLSGPITPPTGKGGSAKAMWRDTIAAINRENAAQAKSADQSR